ALLIRTTRRMGLTVEGELLLTHAKQWLSELDDLERLIGQAKHDPSGLLRVNATLGFGRNHIGPIISRFARKYPEIEVQLSLSVDPPSIGDDLFDVCIRFGAPPDTRCIARQLAVNQRVLCASPHYLAQHGIPKTPLELSRHRFIGIRQGSDTFGAIRLRRSRGTKSELVKTHSPMTTNDGGVAVQWALDGHGVLLRAQWDVQKYLDSGRLVQLLGGYLMPDADIYAVIPAHHRTTVRVRRFVEFVAQALRP
ncbi:MAG: LysR family transcriptional regulator, partial [Burkholderiales bacterium]